MTLYWNVPQSGNLSGRPRAMVAVDGKSDVVGLAYAVNGKPSGATVFAPSDLFPQLWLKRLAFAALEADKDGKLESIMGGSYRRARAKR